MPYKLIVSLDIIMDNMTDIDDVVTTQRGAPSIVFQGFTFRKDKTDEKGELSF